ncbi:hypothetical protein RJ641_012776 [Dillenia turbinata]|uniref:Cyclin-dependent protein kinase inhibitor n=1 Tax=Dillenia turbinata TaxID=194707 RepID=A0AAN8UWY1_9MAGN
MESDAKKWVIAGITLRSPLKLICANPAVKDLECDAESEECLTTPTSEEARIPTGLTCPPAPKKRKASSSRCNYSGVREFFHPPDLESVFMRNVERA